MKQLLWCALTLAVVSFGPRPREGLAQEKAARGSLRRRHGVRHERRTVIPTSKRFGIIAAQRRSSGPRGSPDVNS